jgi:hypothetical protein
MAQLLRDGDVFGTPYALVEVEWTLRVEVVFYIMIATLFAFRFSLFAFRRSPLFERALPLVPLAIVAVAITLGPIPQR